MNGQALTHGVGAHTVRVSRLRQTGDGRAWPRSPGSGRGQLDGAKVVDLEGRRRPCHVEIGRVQTPGRRARRRRSRGPRGQSRWRGGRARSSSSVSLRCEPSPTRRDRVTRASRVTRTGAGLSWPNGPRPRELVREALVDVAEADLGVGLGPDVIGPEPSASRRRRAEGLGEGGDATRADASSRRPRRGRRSDRGSRRARGHRTARGTGSTPPAVRAEPRPMPVSGSMPMTKAGRWIRSTSFAATMPTTPAGQPSPGDHDRARPGSRVAELLERLGHHAILDRCGARCSPPRGPAARAAAASASASSSSSDGSASPRRPGRVDPRRELPPDGALVEVAVAGRRRPRRGARRPRGGRALRRRRPSAVRIRFSAASGTRSAMVPSATRSRSSRTSGSAPGAEVTALAELGAHRRGHVEREADGGHAAEREGRVGAERVDQRERRMRRAAGGHRVVIDDDDLDAAARARPRSPRGRWCRSRR